jgi:CTP synthase
MLKKSRQFKIPTCQNTRVGVLFIIKEDKGQVMAKFIFVTGGVASGLGKGIVAASLGRLLKMRGLKVSAQKFDPYMNVDPGAMSPLQHGEVYVTNDGAETDLDLGHYERFIDEDLNKYSSLTSGKVYWAVLNKERNGGYGGETVQIIPHVTNEIINVINANAKFTKSDIVITEIGGTVGDIESQPFVEAARQVAINVGRQNCLFIHVTLVPFIGGSDEYKSKPTQHSVKTLQSFGISPDIIITRSETNIGTNLLKKIALFCNVKLDCVIENVTIPHLYEAPLLLNAAGLDRVVCRELKIRSKEIDVSNWEALVKRIKERKKTVKIALVGEYVKLHDAYLSVVEALSHAGYENDAIIEIEWVDSVNVNDKNAHAIFKGCQGIVASGAGGEKDIEGMVATCKFARVSDIPFLGICLGAQATVVEFARNVCGLTDANSSEFNKKAKNLVVDLTKGAKGENVRRCGSYALQTKNGTLLQKAYGTNEVNERFRSRHSFNLAFKDALEKGGLTISGTSNGGKIAEAFELNKNKFYLGVQFHPQYKSRPNKAHPLFFKFIEKITQ